MWALTRLHSPPPRGSPGPSPQTHRYCRDATVAHMAVLHVATTTAATLRDDDTRDSGPRGSAGRNLVPCGCCRLGVFGSKTNQLLEGQSAQMPPEEATTPLLASGARALLEITRRCLARLVALPTPVFAAVARRLAERFPRYDSTPGANPGRSSGIPTL